MACVYCSVVYLSVTGMGIRAVMGLNNHCYSGKNRGVIGMKETTEKKICGLCGTEIVHKKGQQQGAYEAELRSEAHRICAATYAGILKKHRISNHNFMRAFISGITELFPEINETKAMKEYKNRMRDVQDEVDEEFPNLKAGGVEKDTKEKEKVAGVKNVVVAGVVSNEEVEEK